MPRTYKNKEYKIVEIGSGDDRTLEELMIPMHDWIVNVLDRYDKLMVNGGCDNMGTSNINEN